MLPVSLSFENISKAYASPVLRSINIEFKAGKVHALMGANGAGKSTLCKIISGLAAVDKGSMLYQGQLYAPTSIRDAESAGIQIMMQELNLLDDLSVAENIYLGQLPCRYGFVDYRQIERESTKLLNKLGISDIDPRRKTASLGIGHKQLIELARTLVRPCKVLILDEPTAALSAAQSNILFEEIERLKQTGVAIIYVSHRMDEIERIADCISVLRDGNVTASEESGVLTQEEIIRSMTGKTISTDRRFNKRQRSKIAVRLENLSAGDFLQDINLDIYHGEILGISGLMGSGRTELLRCIYGADPHSKGHVELTKTSKDSPGHSPQSSVKNGLGFISEDRKKLGLLLEHSVQTNMSLANLLSYSAHSGWLNKSREAADVDRLIEQLAIDCSGCDQTIKELSGGNQQKILIARCLLTECDVLLFDEPTRGIDIQSRTMIYELLNNLALEGKAIVVVSSDDAELSQLCDRIAVMSNGRLADTFDYGEWTQEKLLSAAFRFYSTDSAA
ncbi:MAG: ATP-binding cassette domain-containing protein [Gammaproteobacteria bacterium]|nr:ATP-binding cassette domain-containing protein [Gammaproteobacteria bacterium]